MATAVQLPMPRAVFYDANGNPLSGGFVNTYLPGTTTPATTWQDAGETTPNANPIVLDGAGSALIYGSGSYTFAVTDSLSNSVPAYSGLTSDAVSIVGGTISPAMQPVVAAVTLATAMSTLGISSAMQPVVGAATLAAARGAMGVPPVITATAFAGVDPTGATDSTAGLQSAINAAIATKGMLFIPAGTYLINGTLAVTGTCIIAGESEYGVVFNCANGASDCITVGFQAGAVQGVMIRNLSLVGVGKSGGFGINASLYTNAVFENLSLRNMRNGVSVAQLNNCFLTNIEIICNGAGSYGIRWTSPANNLQRSDVLTIRDCVVNGQGNGQSGLYIDGMCQTLRVSRLGLIRCAQGLYVRNTAASNSFFPQFLYVNDLEIDGVDNSSIIIEGGREMHFVHADCFNAGGAGADTDCVRILADGGGSVTNLLTFVGCRFGGARQRGVYCEGKMVDFIGCYVGDNSIAGLGSWPAYAIANNGGGNGAAIGVNIIGGRTIVFGDLANQSYGVTVAAGCARITITNVDFSSCVTGAIQDNTGSPGNVDWQGCDDINGAPLPDRVPVVSADPAAPYEGMLWENITSHSLKVYLNGAVKTVTVT